MIGLYAGLAFGAIGFILGLCEVARLPEGKMIPVELVILLLMAIACTGICFIGIGIINGGGY